MRLFCLWFLIPLIIWILCWLGCGTWAKRVMIKRGRSRLRIKLVEILIAIATTAILVWYYISLLNDRIHG